MINILNSMKSIDDDTVKIKSALLKAAETRIEGINLYTKGLYIKEQIGKTSVANAFASFKGGSPSPLPEYNGEVENGLAKISVANSYLIDALRLLKNISDTTYIKNIYDAVIADDISYYSDVSEADYENYVKDANYCLISKNYFEAIINCNKALKIRANDVGILSILAKAYSAIGDKENAGKTLKTIEDLNNKSNGTGINFGEYNKPSNNQPPLRLEGIAFKKEPSKRVASINGKVYRILDSVDGYLIKEINEKSIVLEKDHITTELTLNE